MAMRTKDAEGIANSLHPDQTVRPKLGLITVLGKSEWL